MNARLKDLEKWRAGVKALESLSKQTLNEVKKGLGFKTKSRKDAINNAKNPSYRDFRKRKYVGLPEYIMCTFCGKTGHMFNVCEKRLYKKRINEQYRTFQKPKPRTMKIQT